MLHILLPTFVPQSGIHEDGVAGKAGTAIQRGVGRDIELSWVYHRLLKELELMRENGVLAYITMAGYISHFVEDKVV